MPQAFTITVAMNEIEKVSSCVPLVERLNAMLMIHPDDVLRRIYALRPLGHDHADHVARRRLEALGSLGHLGYVCRLRIYRVHREERPPPQPGQTSRQWPYPISREQFLRVAHEPVFVDDLRREFGAGEYKLAIYAPTDVPYLDKPEYLMIDNLGIFGGLPLELAVIVVVGRTEAMLADENPSGLASLLGVT